MPLPAEAFLALFKDTFYYEILKTDFLQAIQRSDVYPFSPSTLAQLEVEVNLSDSDSMSTSDHSEISRTGDASIPFDLKGFVSFQEKQFRRRNLPAALIYRKISDYLSLLDVECPEQSLSLLNVPHTCFVPIPSAELNIEEVIPDKVTTIPIPNSVASLFYEPVSPRESPSPPLPLTQHNLQHLSTVSPDASSYGPDDDQQSGSWNTVSCDLDNDQNNFESFIIGNDHEEQARGTFPTGLSTINQPPNQIRTRYLERNNKVYKTFRTRHRLTKQKQRELLDDNLRYFHQTLLREFYSKYLLILRKYKEEKIINSFKYNFSFDRSRRFSSFYFHLRFIFDDRIDYNTKRNIHNELLPFFRRMKTFVQNLNSDIKWFSF